MCALHCISHCPCHPLPRARVCVQVIPEDQRELRDDQALVEVRHFWHLRTHSEPFYAIVNEVCCSRGVLCACVRACVCVWANTSA